MTMQPAQAWWLWNRPLLLIYRAGSIGSNAVVT
jgi:hypothetical protein